MKAVVESMNLETIVMETLAMDLRMALVMVLLPLKRKEPSLERSDCLLFLIERR